MKYSNRAAARFLHRCPELKDVLGHSVGKENETKVNKQILAKLFLTPNYTIRVLGCFPSLVKDIVEGAVSLLRSCDLVTNTSEELDCMIEDGAFNFIESYTQSGKGLYLHELACLAFCRALDLNESVLGAVATYFTFAPPPFQRFLLNETILESMDIKRYIFSARISFRFLLLRADYFLHLWDWSRFPKLADKMSSVCFAATNSKDCDDLKWCMLQILCTIGRVSDAAVLKFLKFELKAEEAADSLLRWEEFCEDVSVEKISPFIEPYVQPEEGCSEQNKVIGGQNDLPTLHCCSTRNLEIDEIEPQFKTRKLPSSAQSFIMTSN